jgi:hypothetical protein
MVQQALNRHSQIAIPPETKFFFSFFGQCRQCQAGHIERLNGDLNIHLPAPAKRISSVADGRAFYDLIARHYLERVPKRDLVYFGDKTPEHTGQVSRIRNLFPTAKILVLYRDGRDVALSLTKVPWMSPNVYVNFSVWLYYARVVRQLNNVADPNVYVARYEDIVTDPEAAFRQILQFLGLRYEPAVPNDYGNREGVPEREFAWKWRALEKITTDRIGVFRQELSSSQIELLDRLGKDALPALGYPLLTDGNKALSLGFLMKLSFHMSKLLSRIPWDSLVNEVFGRSLWCRAQRHSSRRSSMASSGEEHHLKNAPVNAAVLA